MVSREGAGHAACRSRALVAATVAGLLWVAAYACWLKLQPAAPGRRALAIVDVAYLVPIAAAVVVALLAARRAPAGLRIFWALVALACGSWLAGEVLWSAKDLVSGSVPFPWWTDALYIWFYPLLAAGLLATLRPQLSCVRAGRLLDAALAVGSLSLLWWWFVLRPLPLGFDLASTVAVAGPAMALLLLGVLVAIRL